MCGMKGKRGGPDRPHDAHDATFLVAAGVEHVLYILAKRPKHVLSAVFVAATAVPKPNMQTAHAIWVQAWDCFGLSLVWGFTVVEGLEFR